MGKCSKAFEEKDAKILEAICAGNDVPSKNSALRAFKRGGAHVGTGGDGRVHIWFGMRSMPICALGAALDRPEAESARRMARGLATTLLSHNGMAVRPT